MFENLQVYQKAVDLADNVAGLTEGFPRGYYFLTDQLNRAALSVATNLVEGNGRCTKSAAPGLKFAQSPPKVGPKGCLPCVPQPVLSLPALVGRSKLPGRASRLSFDQSAEMLRAGKADG